MRIYEGGKQRARRSDAHRPGIAPPCHAVGGAPAGCGGRQPRRRPVGSRGNQHDVEVARAAHQLGGGRGAQPRAPAATLGRADQHARGVARVRVFHQGLGRRRTAERHGLPAERFRQPQHVDAAVALLLRQAQQPGRLDVHDGPVRIERIRHALAGAHQLLGLLVGTDGNQQPVAGDARRRLGSIGRRARARPPPLGRRRGAARSRAAP